MKILCLSDLHRNLFNKNKINMQDIWIKNLLYEHKPNIIVVTGDIHESNSLRNPYADLQELMEGIPTICTLGNHEFYDSTIPITLRRYKEKYNPNKYDVHYLDVINEKIIDIEGKSILFFGNWLGYDGSLSTVPDQNLYEWAYYDGNYHWADRMILEYNYIATCKNNIRKIKNTYKKYKNDKCIKILCTHCVPHRNINGWINTSHDIVGKMLNAYSGVDNILDDMKIDYSISGHTHFRVVGNEINGIKCINVGSCYHLDSYKYFILEI